MTLRNYLIPLNAQLGQQADREDQWVVVILISCLVGPAQHEVNILPLEEVTRIGLCATNHLGGDCGTHVSLCLSRGGHLFHPHSVEGAGRSGMPGETKQSGEA